MAPSSRWCFGRRHSDPQNNYFRDISGNIVRDFIGDKKGDIVMNFKSVQFSRFYRRCEQFDLQCETRAII